MLSKNVTPVDRVIRIVLGLALLALVVVGPQTRWGLIGLVPLVTGAFGRCPIYSILSSRRRSQRPGRTAG